MRIVYLLMYLLVITVVTASFFPLSKIVRARLKQNYEQELMLRFQQNIIMMEDSIRQVYHIPDTMSSYQVYREALMVEGREKLHSTLSKMIITSRIMNKYMSLIPLTDSVFLLFTKSGTVIDNTQLYLSQEEFLSFGLHTQDYSIQEQIDMIQGEQACYQLHEASLRGGKEQGGLLILMKHANSSVRVGIFFTDATLLKCFQMDSLLNGGLQLCDTAGKVVYEWGHISDQMEVICKPVNYANLMVKLYVPEIYYNALLLEFDNLYLNTILITVVVGVIISVILTIANYRPLRKLMNLSGKKHHYGNEYEILYEHIKDSDHQLEGFREDVAVLSERLRESLFTRLLNGSVLSEEEIEMSWRMFPQLADKNRLAIVKIASGVEDQESKMQFFTFLDSLKDDGVYWQQVSLTRAAALIPNQIHIIEKLHRMATEQNRELSGNEDMLLVGISAPFSGPQQMYLAYHQADIALFRQSVIAEFELEEEPNEKNIIELATLQRLYELLISGEGDAAVDILTETGERIRKHAVTDDARIESASLFHFVFDIVQNDMKLTDVNSIPLHKLLQSDQEEILSILKKEAFAIAEAINDRKKRMNHETSDRVMQYIQEHFDSPSIYADSIANVTHVSANTVYQIARESTGKSLGEYIESLRLQMACRLLRETDEPVTEILEHCGWSHPATFYRVFKSNIGVPPAQYRKQMTGTGIKKDSNFENGTDDHNT